MAWSCTKRLLFFHGFHHHVLRGIPQCEHEAREFTLDECCDLLLLDTIHMRGLEDLKLLLEIANDSCHAMPFLEVLVELTA